jgi:cytochrome b involved in lipid metabolism
MEQERKHEQERKYEQQYKMEDIVLHNKDKDCWIVIDGSVYNVTKFIYDHPGGPDVLLEYAGKDCTDVFNDIGHSSDAYVMMEKYKIGKLVKN